MRLPDHHHHDDAEWLRRQLSVLPVRCLARATEGYSEVYRAAHDAEPADHKKDNAARFAANTRLRAFVAAQRRAP